MGRDVKKAIRSEESKGWIRRWSGWTQFKRNEIEEIYPQMKKIDADKSQIKSFSYPEFLHPDHLEHLRTNSPRFLFLHPEHLRIAHFDLFLISSVSLRVLCGSIRLSSAARLPIKS
jgi:hypothetical protein